MATEADLIQKFKDLNIPVGADFEELIHEAFVGANLVDKVNSKADDSKVVHNTGAEEISGQKTFDVAPIDRNTGNPYITRDGVPTIDLSNYPTKDQLATKADDSKVAHLSGANNFGTVPTVNNNPLLLASSLPSTLADTTKLSNFTAGLQKGGADVATQSDVTTAISTATANMVDSTKATNFTAGLQSGGVDVATAADLKSVEDKAWKLLVNSDATTAFYRLVDGTLYISGYARVPGGGISPSLTISSQPPAELQNKVWTIQKKMTVGSSNVTADLSFDSSSLSVSCFNQGNQVPSSIVVFNNSYTQS